VRDCGVEGLGSRPSTPGHGPGVPDPAAAAAAAAARNASVRPADCKSRGKTEHANTSVAGAARRSPAGRRPRHPASLPHHQEDEEGQPTQERSCQALDCRHATLYGCLSPGTFHW